MSSSVGYDYSYRDLEAERRRALHAEIAELRQELAQVTKQNSCLGGRRRTRAVRSQSQGSGSAELTRERDRLRDQIIETRTQLEESFRTAWAVRAGEGLSESTHDKSARRSRQPVAVQVADFARERQATINSVGEALHRDLPRCYPDDLIALTERAAELAETENPTRLRERRLEFESVLADSIERQKTSARREITRARLRALASETLSAERSGLLLAIEAAADPEALTDRVKAALARADQAHARDAVAEAAAAALREIGCDVGEEFVSQLSGRGESLTAFADQQRSGYGLLIRLSAEGTRFQAAVVRREDIRATPERDTQMQREFCTTGLPAISDQLESDGVSLSMSHRLEPGQRPPGQVPADRWPAMSQRTAGEAARRRHQSRTTHTTQQQRERAREH